MSYYIELSSQNCPFSQEMNSAVITYCGHFFHGNCLRKWLYVQETCPMCHQTVRPAPQGQSQASGDAPAAPTQRDTGPDLPAQEGDQNQDNDMSRETQSEAVTPDHTEQQEEMESFEHGDCGTPDQPDEPHGEVQGLRFSSSGDFVGFASPVSSYPAGAIFSSHELLGKTSPSNMHGKGEEVGKESPLPLSPYAVNENMVEGQSDINEAEFEVNFCPRVPQNNDDEHGSCVGIPQSWNSLDSPESNNANKNLETSGISLIDNQTSVRSCNEKLECIEDPQTYNNNGAYSDLDLDLDRLREAETAPQRSSSEATFSCMSTNSSD